MTQEKFEEAQELHNQMEAVSEFASVMCSLIVSDIDEVRVSTGRRLIIANKAGNPVASLTVSDALPLELLQRVEDCIYGYATELNEKFRKL